MVNLSVLLALVPFFMPLVTAIPQSSDGSKGPNPKYNGVKPSDVFNYMIKNGGLKPAREGRAAGNKTVTYYSVDDTKYYAAADKLLGSGYKPVPPARGQPFGTLANYEPHCYNSGSWMRTSDMDETISIGCSFFKFNSGADKAQAVVVDGGSTSDGKPGYLQFTYLAFQGMAREDNCVTTNKNIKENHCKVHL